LRDADFAGDARECTGQSRKLCVASGKLSATEGVLELDDSTSCDLRDTDFADEGAGRPRTLSVAEGVPELDDSTGCDLRDTDFAGEGAGRPWKLSVAEGVPELDDSTGREPHGVDFARGCASRSAKLFAAGAGVGQSKELSPVEGGAELVNFRHASTAVSVGGLSRRAGSRRGGDGSALHDLSCDRA
jgi:hypothetical protein